MNEMQSALARQIETADFQIENHGSIILVRPLNSKARDFLSAHVEESAQWFGSALVVEPRYIEGVTQQLIEDGFTVE